MISIEEKYRGTSGDSSRWTLGYILIADGDDSEITEFAAKNAVAAHAPNTLEDVDSTFLLLNDIQIEEFHPGVSRTIVIASAIYGSPEKGSLLNPGDTTPPASVEAITEFNYQAPSDTLYYALDTRTYFNETAAPFGLPSIQNRIRVDFLGDHETQGISVPVGTTHSWQLTVPKGFQSPAYESIVESLIGKTNSEPFKGRPIGTMRLVNFSSTLNATSGNLHLYCGMQYSGNREDVTLAGITGVDIGGHEIWWSCDRRIIQPDVSSVTLFTLGIYVQRLWEAGDLNLLGF